MPYDPQRSRTRPQLAEAEPAPVEALLEPVASPEPPAQAQAASAAPAAPGSSSLDSSPPVTSEGEKGHNATTKVVAVVAVTVGLGLAWLLMRRLRRRS